MTTISVQQARKRFTTIPSRLQDALFSTQTAEIMDGIAQQYHLDNLKLDAVGKVVGWALLGFVHPEDVKNEIQSQLNLPPQVAVDVAKSLDLKIFDALRDDLTSVYAPAPLPSEETTSPKIIQEVTPTPKPVGSVTISTPPPTPAPQSTSPIPALSVPVPPKSVVVRTGWSKQAPAPAGIGEFERLDAVKVPQAAIPQPPKPGAAAPTASQPAPIIMNDFETAKPLSKSSDIHFALASKNVMGDTKPVQMPTPAKPALLEFGNAAASRPQVNSAVPTPEPKVVHYSEFKTSVPPKLPPGPRQITEVTAQSTQPAPPTMPAVVPVPTPPPSMQKSAVATVPTPPAPPKPL